MDAVSVEEWELIEVNPTYLDARDPWPYTDALFQVEQGSTVLSFSIAPAYRDVRVILTQSGATLYELNAMSVLDVKCRRDGLQEFVEVVLGDGDILTLSVKPAIRLQHECTRQSHE